MQLCRTQALPGQTWIAASSSPPKVCDGAGSMGWNDARQSGPCGGCRAQSRCRIHPWPARFTRAHAKCEWYHHRHRTCSGSHLGRSARSTQVRGGPCCIGAPATVAAGGHRGRGGWVRSGGLQAVERNGTPYRARRKIVKINPEVASAGDKLGPVRMQGRRVDAADHGERDAAHLLERRAVQEDHVIARGHGQRAAVGRDLDARHRPAELQAAGLPQHARVPGAQRAVLGPGHHLLAGGLLGEEEHLDHFVVACQEVGLGLGLGQVEYSHHILLAPRGDAP
mmetsp:Transcript_19412/g.65085  ORF Transcript_19412/g.65085 Transcript_19412/m.65085 type:complete len:281 (-) Transcript_19412:348-1190(-)